jgi:putative Mn2+ efflux pump MntP
MKLSEILLMAVGLAMDATAVSAARGLAVSAIRARHVISVAAFFGGFQAFMPLVGWAMGARIGPLVAAWDHWIACTVLCAVGGKMLWEVWSHRHEESLHLRDADPFGLTTMLALAVATSIDALAVGVTLPMLNAPLGLSLMTIGVTTALLSVAGLFAGKRFGAALGPRLDVVGGLVLVGLGVKTLCEHLGAE